MSKGRSGSQIMACGHDSWPVARGSWLVAFGLWLVSKEESTVGKCGCTDSCMALDVGYCSFKRQHKGAQMRRVVGNDLPKSCGLGR